VLTLLDEYDAAARRLLSSLRTAGIPVTPVVIRYGGELPTEARCPIAEHAGIRRSGTPRFFNEVPVPPWCEIRQGRRPYGEVLRDGETLARIHYEPRSFRQVESVEWLLANGSTTHTDLYDRYGNHYATTHVDAGTAYQTVYRGSGPYEVEADLVSRAVVLRSADRVLTFTDLTELVSRYLDEHGLDEGVRGPEALISSLSHPLFVQRRQAGERPATTLFWQEPMPGEIPGNMALELEEPKALRRIVFEDERLLRKVADAYPDTAVELIYLSPLRQFAERTGVDLGRCFTLTATDEMPGLDVLLERFPHVTFSVAALTQMSARLYDLARRFPNLRLTPTITHAGIAAELAQASVYLDIDAGPQVLGVVGTAYHLNLVVLAPAERAKAPDCSLTCASVEALVARLGAVTSSEEGRAEALAALHTLRGPLSTAEDYRRVLG